MTVHQKMQLVNRLAASFVSTTEKINKRQILSVSILLLLVLGSMVMAVDDRKPFTNEWFKIKANSDAIKGGGVVGAYGDAEGKFYVVGTNLYFVQEGDTFDKNKADNTGILIEVDELSDTKVGVAPPAAPTPPPAAAAVTAATSTDTVESVQTALSKGTITHFEASERLDVLAAEAAPVGSTATFGGKPYRKTGIDEWSPVDPTDSTKTLNTNKVKNTELQSVDRTGKDVSSLVIPPPVATPTRMDLDSAKSGATVVYKGDTLTYDGANWKNSKGETVTILDEDISKGNVKNLESKEAKDAKAIQKQADTDFYQSTWFESIKLHGNFYSDTLRKYGDVGGAFFQGLARLGEYQALSNALMPETTQAWLKAADNEFLNTWADVPGRITAEACEIDDLKQSERPGQNAIFVRTASGVDQPVGSIFAEVSPSTSPILCERNTDEEAEEEFICNDGLVCKDNAFCYESEDDEQPAQGYFYKITWGVSAPADAKFTPNIDEDGKAIKLNLALYGYGAPLWLYESDTAREDSVIELSNGDSYTETITHFAPKELQFTKACIIFNSQYRIKDFEGDEIPEICATFESSTQGQVEFAKSDRSTPSVTPATGEVRRSRNWRRS